MKHKWPLAGRTPRLAPLVAVFFAAVVLAAPLKASAVPVLCGGNLYYTGGDVAVDLLHSDTAYGEVLQLRSALAVLDVAEASKVGSRVTLTAQQIAEMGIKVGDELQFSIHVNDTGHNFVLGSGERNIDGVAHAIVRHTAGGGDYVGFEDLYGGGDCDYNDTIFRFSSGTSTTGNPKKWKVPHEDVPDGTIPEPSALLLMVSGIGMLGLCARKS